MAKKGKGIHLAKVRTKEENIERYYKSGWHIIIAAVGCVELKRSKTIASKILSVGLIAFHIDGALSDFFDTPTLSRRLLETFTKSGD